MEGMVVMEIIIKDVNKNNEFLNEVKRILEQYQYLPTNQITGQEIERLCEEYFNENEPLYGFRPYIFLKSYIDVRKQIEYNTANFVITGYDFYTNDKYDVILVYSMDGKQIEKNYGNFLQLFKSNDFSIARKVACCIENRIMEDEKLRKELLIKKMYDLKECDRIDFSYKEWLHIYQSISDALCERHDKMDKLICNKILSYLYTNNVLDIDEYSNFYIKDNIKRGGNNGKI